MTETLYKLCKKKKLSHSKMYRINNHGTPHYYIDIWGPKMKQQRLESESVRGLYDLVDAI